MTRRPTITVIYACASGFVTDLGAPVPFTDHTGQELELQRYGVWRPEHGKPQVFFVTNDLGDAMRAAKRGHA